MGVVLCAWSVNLIGVKALPAPNRGIEFLEGLHGLRESASSAKVRLDILPPVVYLK